MRPWICRGRGKAVRVVNGTWLADANGGTGDAASLINTNVRARGSWRGGARHRGNRSGPANGAANDDLRSRAVIV